MDELVILSRTKKSSGLLAVAALLWAGAAVPAKAAGQQKVTFSSDASSSTSWAASVRAALARRGSEVASAARNMQHGMASWYGGRFAKRKTSTGERFDPLQLTAAHPSAPLGSKLLVRSEETGRSVVVTVNDRGPYARGRIIDLSHAAAERLGMLNRGVAHVTVSRLKEEEAVEVAQAPE
ncbi:septal ring lytic transglycosylase RlpA family protein [Acetobacter sp.]|uniref:septal ring lytic transglycosylase RlpA family protein n=1 Tax=Acetobacter sp. TaxID=440 RepID=UPI0039EAB698